MADIIDRQAAIDTLNATITITGERNALEVSDYIKTVKERLEELPSAEPEIIRCKDCKYRDPEDKSCGCGHDIIWQLSRDDNWFCADGKRMVDDPSHPFADDVMMG